MRRAVHRATAIDIREHVLELKIERHQTARFLECLDLEEARAGHVSHRRPCPIVGCIQVARERLRRGGLWWHIGRAGREKSEQKNRRNSPGHCIEPPPQRACLRKGIGRPEVRQWPNCSMLRLPASKSSPRLRCSFWQALSALRLPPADAVLLS